MRLEVSWKKKKNYYVNVFQLSSLMYQCIYFLRSFPCSLYWGSTVTTTTTRIRRIKKVQIAIRTSELSQDRDFSSHCTNTSGNYPKAILINLQVKSDLLCVPESTKKLFLHAPNPTPPPPWILARQNWTSATPPQPPTVACITEAQLEQVSVACTFFARLSPTCMLSRCLSTKFLHRSSVGSLLRVRCWLGLLLSSFLLPPLNDH